VFGEGNFDLVGFISRQNRCPLSFNNHREMRVIQALANLREMQFFCPHWWQIKFVLLYETLFCGPGTEIKN